MRLRFVPSTVSWSFSVAMSQVDRFELWHTADRNRRCSMLCFTILLPKPASLDQTTQGSFIKSMNVPIC